MASFLVETFIKPGDHAGFEAAAARIASAIEAMGGRDDGIRHVRSYLVPRDETGVHVIEAESADAVIRLSRAASIEVERIVAAIGVDPAHEARATEEP